jgi:hypothetical protein
MSATALRKDAASAIAFSCSRASALLDNDDDDDDEEGGDDDEDKGEVIGAAAKLLPLPEAPSLVALFPKVCPWATLVEAAAAAAALNACTSN